MGAGMSQGDLIGSGRGSDKASETAHRSGMINASPAGEIRLLS